MVLYESFTILSRGLRQQGAGRKEGKALDLRVTDIPTVVHCHEISHEKEWVRQHAHGDLEAQKSGVHRIKKASSSLCMLAKLYLNIKYRPAFVPRPRALTPQQQEEEKSCFSTYPHHKFCVAPDHRRLAELERETKATVEQVGDTSLSLSLHDIPLSPRRWVWGRKQW